MTWETVSVRLRKTSEGKIDSRYPQGVLPGTPLTWGVIPDQTAVEGEIVSLNVRSYLSGTDSGTVTITVDGALPTGWTLSGSTLSYSGTGTGSATVRLLADGTTASPYFGVSSVAAQVGDTVAPTVPPQISATVSGANITVEFDQSMDPHDGTTPGSLIQKYDLYRNDALLTSITSLGNGVSTASPMTAGDIGSPSAAGSSTQDVYDWSLTSRGQVDGSVDAFRFVRMSLATPHVITAKVTSITGFTSDFAKAGVMVRASTDPGAAFVTAQVRQNGTLRLEYRAATGGSRKTIGAAALADSARMDDVTPPYVWLQLRPSGDRWTAYYSEDGSTWNLLEAIDVSLPPDSLHGIFTCASNADNAVTAEFEDFAIAPATKGSYTHAPGSVSTYKVRAVDNANNASAFGHTVTATPESAPAPVVQVKNWNPGHYIRPGPNRSLAEYQSWLDICVADGFWKGVQVILEWKHLENSTGTAYNWTLLDAVLNYAISKNKQVCLNLWTGNFGYSLTNLTSPAYIQSAPYGADYYRGDGMAVRMWNNATWDRYILLCQAVIDRYKGESNFEFVRVKGETALGQTPSDYTFAAADANLRRLVDETMNRGGKTWVCIGPNFWNSQATIEELAQKCVQYAGGFGMPDVSVRPYSNVGLNRLSTGNKVYIGSLGGVDYRGVFPNATNQEAALNSNTQDSEYQIGKQFISHMSWTTNASTGTGETFADLRAYLPTVIDADPLQYTAYPTSWPTA